MPTRMSSSARALGISWDKSEQQHRPVPLETREEAGVRQQFWVIDGKVRGFRFPAFSDAELAKRQQQVGRKFAEQQESRELGNAGPACRLCSVCPMP